jgi:hypothetical protein
VSDCACLPADRDCGLFDFWQINNPTIQQPSNELHLLKKAK